MQVTYNGRHTNGVEVGPDSIPIGFGETVDLPDDLAKQLCEQAPAEFTATPTKKSTKGDPS